MMIEMKADTIIINGKPLSEFIDSNISVFKGRGPAHNRHDMLRPGPPHGGGNAFFDEDGEESARPFLGVMTEKNDNGAKITEVVKGSGAEKAGLKENDIITKVGNDKIEDPKDLADAVRKYKPASPLKIYYTRNGKPGSVTTTSGERKEMISKRFFFNEDDLPPMDVDVMKDLRMEMPPMPKGPFNHFGMPPHKKLGIRIEDTGDNTGVKITNVDPSSAAAKAGLQNNDIITEVDGEKVNNTEEAAEQVMKNEKPYYTIKVKRGDAEMSFEIKNEKPKHSANL